MTDERGGGAASAPGVSDTQPALVAAPVSYVRAVVVGLVGGFVLGGVGAWLCTVLWFAFYGAQNLATDLLHGMVVGMFFGMFIGPTFGVIVAVPTAVVVAWMRNHAKGVQVVRQVAALMAGTAMLLLVVLGLGNSAEVSAGNAQDDVTLGWVVPLGAFLWSAACAYLLSVWRPPVVVGVDEANRGTEQRGA